MLKQGYVERVKELPSKYTWPNGAPKPSMWSMTVDNISYGTKNVKPPAEGTYIQFEATQNGQYWNADGSTIKAVDAPAKPSTVNTAAVAAFTGNSRDASIHYQSSRKDALEFVGMLLTHGLIDFGKAKGAQKIEIAEIYLDNYTTRFNEDIKRLAPPEHSSPVDAESPAEATAIAKPQRARVKASEIVASDAPFNDDLPF